ncbi:MAG: dockerin type I domain-containing protein [Phycisphaerales bacterium]
MISRSLLFIGCAAASLAPLASDACADVSISSPDQRWVAMIRDSGGGAGQCVKLEDQSQPAPLRNNVSQTIHYVRLAGGLQFANTYTQRMEDTFTLLRFASTAHEFAAVLRSNTVAGVVAIVHGEMVSGAEGGLRVSLAFADTTPAATLFATVVKPFVYVNLNVDNQVAGNTGDWSVDHFAQTTTATGTGNVRWFAGRSPAAHASSHDGFMQSGLDLGLVELNNLAFTGPGDINTAISFAQSSLVAGATSVSAYAIGDEGITVPNDFGFAPTVGAVGITSGDGRWGATVRTGYGAPDFGTAGTITSAADFDEPIATSSFLASSTCYAAIGAGQGAASAPLSSTFARIAFLSSASAPRMFMAVLNSKDDPGMIAIIDAQMLDGDSGGLVSDVVFANLGTTSLTVTPLVSADMDVDGTAINLGGFAASHFHQKSAARSANNVRWFRSDTFETYESDEAIELSLAFDQGVTSLGDVVLPGPANLATAFAYSPRVLAANQATSLAFAIGNAGIAIPASFAQPDGTPACPVDLNSDGAVDATDLAQLLGAWGASQPGGAADLNGDGNVDASDLAIVLGAWGPCS